ncbi:MAG: TIGR03000 domain-containing protein [Gemmataceae bacterium]|nr:TIGR03000 domain-containing protein [Gemmataceae bacterium]
MFRLPLILAVLAVWAASAAAQSPIPAQPQPLPLSPGVMPGSPIGPGTQFLPQPVPRFVPFAGRRVQPPAALGWGPFGFAAPFPYFGFGGYSYDYAIPPVVVVVPGGAPGPARPQPAAPAVTDLPATLALQFPAPAEVWLDGKKAGAGEEVTLTSPAVRRGDSYTFDVTARWEAGGKRYEATRKVAVEAGGRSRLIVVSGTEVK